MSASLQKDANEKDLSALPQKAVRCASRKNFSSPLRHARRARESRRDSTTSSSKKVRTRVEARLEKHLLANERHCVGKVLAEELQQLVVRVDRVEPLEGHEERYRVAVILVG